MTAIDPSTWPSIHHAGNILLRPATMDDAVTLFSWRNDPVTRQMSRTTDPVEWWTHVAWLEHTLPQIEVACLRNGTLGFPDHTPVGTVRLCPVSANTLEVSYTVSPQWRGFGWGTAIIWAVMPRAVPATPLIVAHVKPINIPSCRVFERLGWEKATDGDSEAGLITYRYEVKA